MDAIYALIIVALILIVLWNDSFLVRGLAVIGIGLAGYVLYQSCNNSDSVGVRGLWTGAAEKATAKKSTASKDAKKDKPKDRPARSVHFKAKWKDIDPEDIRKKLKDNKAKLVHSSHTHHQKFYANPDTKGYGIVSEEYTKEGDCQLVYTQFGKFEFPEMKVVKCDKYDEITKTISKDKKMNLQLEMEMLREKHTMGKDCQITIDHLPGLNPYVEIDCKTEEELLDVAKKLGLDPELRSYGGLIKTYNTEYQIDGEKFKNGKIDELKFKTVYNKLKSHVKENANKFKEIAKKGASS